MAVKKSKSMEKIPTRRMPKDFEFSTTKKPAPKKLLVKRTSAGKTFGKAVVSPISAAAKAAEAYTKLLTLPARTIKKQRKRSK